MGGFGREAVLKQDVSLVSELKDVKEKLAETEQKNSDLKSEKFKANLFIDTLQT